MAHYDKHYQQPKLFGEPYPAVVDFMKHWRARASALDLGCEQGRDALFLAELGFKVTGVDISVVGLEQMLREATQKGLELKGLLTYTPG
jgi:SAM-dependent methyltransferase